MKNDRRRRNRPRNREKKGVKQSPGRECRHVWSGGEIIGLIDAIRFKLSNLRRVVVKAVDGNPYAVEFCRNIIEFYKTQVGQGLTIDADILDGSFSNYEELGALASWMGNTFDIIMSFKALNEVILTGSWGARNPYKDFLDTFSSHVSESGVLLHVNPSVVNFGAIAV